MNEFADLLLVAALFGGMMLYCFGFAPMVFSALPAEDSGRFIRAAFPWYYLFVIATAGFVGAILLLSNSRSGAIAAAAIYARQVPMPRINATLLPKQPPITRRKHFSVMNACRRPIPPCPHQ